MNAPQTKPAASPADDTQKVIALKTAQTPTTLAAEEADTAKEVVLDDRKPRRWGWLLLILGMGGLGLWAGYAPLDQGIAAPGQVVVTGNRKAVQPMASGLVSALLVKEGDQVKAGQVVLRLDDTQARSQLEVARGQLLSLQATEARLNAERVGAQAISWPASFNASSDRRAAEAVALNQQLFRSRRETQQGELAAMNESLGGLQAQLEGLEASRRNKDEQLRFLREELKGQRELAAEGFLPRNRLFEQERLLAQLNAQVSEDLANIARNRSAIAEMKTRILTRRQEFQRDAEAQLSDIQRDLGMLLARINALEFDVRNTEVRSPADGKVVGLNIFTVGGVVQAGSVLMDVVPADEPLKVEAQIPPHLIDKIRVGMPVDILFPAFLQTITPNIPGSLVNISADVLTDPATRQPYYKAQVVVTPEGMAALKTNQIKAGMPAEVFIRAGERTAFNYIVKPLTDRIRAAMTEE